jgi:FkbM family methyltransferase
VDEIHQITFKTILHFVGEAKEACIKGFVNETKPIELTSIRVVMRFPYRIAKKILEKMNIELKYIRSPEEMYYFNNKRWYIDFLEYCLKNRDRLAFDLLPFMEEDRREILKFVRNKVIGALLDRVEKDKLFDPEDLMYSREYEKMTKEIRKKGRSFHLKWEGKDYFLPINCYSTVVFYHKHGIHLIPGDVKKGLAGKDVIDAGAFIGESALILNELQPRKIYAFEPMEENLQLLKKTIELNALSNIVVVSKVLSSCEGTLKIQSLCDSSFISETGSKKIDATTIDKFVEEHKLEVGLIKMDIEGAEYDAILGAERTIKEQSPVLIVALYHDGRSFFEIPKKLMDWNPFYKFRFLNLCRGDPIGERVLVAYHEDSNY